MFGWLASFISTYIVEDLIENLKNLLNAPKRRQLYYAIRSVIHLNTVLFVPPNSNTLLNADTFQLNSYQYAVSHSKVACYGFSDRI